MTPRLPDRASRQPAERPSSRREFLHDAGRIGGAALILPSILIGCDDSSESTPAGPAARPLAERAVGSTSSAAVGCSDLNQLRGVANVEPRVAALLAALDLVTAPIPATIPTAKEAAVQWEAARRANIALIATASLYPVVSPPRLQILGDAVDVAPEPIMSYEAFLARERALGAALGVSANAVGALGTIVLKLLAVLGIEMTEEQLHGLVDIIVTTFGALLTQLLTAIRHLELSGAIHLVISILAKLGEEAFLSRVAAILGKEFAKMLGKTIGKKLVPGLGLFLLAWGLVKQLAHQLLGD